MRKKKSNTRNLLVDLKNLVSPYLYKIEKENKEDAQKINTIISKINQNLALSEDEIKDFFYFMKKYQTFIPLDKRKEVFEPYKNLLKEEYRMYKGVAGELTDFLMELKRKYNFDFESFAKETFSEKVQRFLEKETPGYFISLFAGPPIGFIGYGMQKYMGVPSILTHGTMGLLSLGTSYLTELTHEDIDEYPGIFSWEHLKSRWGHIGTKTLISYLGAHVTKKILEDINKPQEML